MADTPTVLLIAGEASGDLYAGALATALRRAAPDLRLLGMGGPRMEAAGVELRFPLTDVAVMGFVEVLAQLRAVRRAWNTAVDLLNRERPDVVVLVDYPGFNLRLAEAAHRRGIPVVYYVSPQLWAWKPGRVRIVRRAVTRMLVILPFEVAWYAQHGVTAHFVGHPLVEAIRLPFNEAPVGTPARVALLPGSRRSDWTRMAPVLFAAARTLRERLPTVQFVLPFAETADRDWLQDLPPALDIQVVASDWTARADCDLAVAKSGTTSVEHALLGLPTVIVYRTSPVTYAIARRLVRVPYIGMVNLIAGEPVCPELIQRDATPERIAHEAFLLLTDEERRRRMREGMRRVCRALAGPGASACAAEHVLAVLGRTPAGACDSVQPEGEGP